jgi:hypothetical protein
VVLAGSGNIVGDRSGGHRGVRRGYQNKVAARPGRLYSRTWLGWAQSVCNPPYISFVEFPAVASQLKGTDHSIPISKNYAFPN